MIWIIVLLGFSLRLINLNQSLWLDEAINILATKNTTLWQMITQYSLADFHPPGFFIILWITNHLFGYSEVASRLPSLIFGVFSIYLIYLIGQRAIDKKVGLMSALFLSINGLHIYYSQEARMYSFTTFSVLLNILSFQKLINSDKRSGIFYSLSAILVISSDYVSYLIFPAEFIYLLFSKKNKLKDWVFWNISTILVFVIWLPIFIKQLGVGINTAHNLPVWNEVVGSFSLKSLALTYIKFIIGRISFEQKDLYYLGLTPALILFSFVLLIAIKKFSQDKLVYYLSAVPLISAWLISIKLSIFSYFRVLYILPDFLIIISVGLYQVQKNWLRELLFGLVCFTFILTSGIYFFDKNQQRENWKGLVDDLAKKNDGVVLMESNGLFAPFEYYLIGKDIKSQPGLKSLPARSLNDDVVDIKLLKTNKIYLLQYLVEVFDPDKLLSQKIITSGFKLTKILNYHGVGLVYEYSK